ncbi:MAG: ABC transporter permease [Planctomycetaceae bacterium]
MLGKYRNELGLLIAIVVVLLGTAAFSPAYHSVGGLAQTAQIILRESALVGIFALGAATVIISGGIDLSSGSVIAFSGMFFFCVLVLLAPDNPEFKLAGQADIADRHVADIIKKLDADENRSLSYAEIQQAAFGEQLAKVYPKLTDEESPIELKRDRFDHRDARALILDDLMATYDANESGSLDEEEIGKYNASKKSQMKNLDSNSDGELTIAEMTFRYGPKTDGLPLWIIGVAIIATLFVGFLIGTLHAWLITVVNLPPFVATLASLVGIRSLARLLILDLMEIRYAQRPSNVTIPDEFLTSVGRENWWFPCVVWIVLCFALWVLLSRTVMGRRLYAIGGNEEAAKLSGIRTEQLKWLAYCISSMTAALAGIFYACYIGSANPATDGMGYELNAIAASVVGGCSLTGGVGTVLGVVLGTVFLRLVIDSVAKLFKSQPDLFEGLVVGALVVLAVAINALRGAGGIRKQFFPGRLGLMNVAILSLLGGVMMAVTTQENKLMVGLGTGLTVLVLLSAKAFAERAALARENA